MLQSNDNGVYRTAPGKASGVDNKLESWLLRGTYDLGQSFFLYLKLFSELFKLEQIFLVSDLMCNFDPCKCVMCLENVAQNTVQIYNFDPCKCAGGK